MNLVNRGVKDYIQLGQSTLPNQSTPPTERLAIASGVEIYDDPYDKCIVLRGKCITCHRDWTRRETLLSIRYQKAVPEPLRSIISRSICPVCLATEAKEAMEAKKDIQSVQLKSLPSIR